MFPATLWLILTSYRTQLSAADSSLSTLSTSSNMWQIDFKCCLYEQCFLFIQVFETQKLWHLTYNSFSWFPSLCFVDQPSRCVPFWLYELTWSMPNLHFITRAHLLNLFCVIKVIEINIWIYYYSHNRNLIQYMCSNCADSVIICEGG